MSKKRTISRRSLLRDGAAAAAGGAALLAQARTALGQAPAVVTQRRFKAWISRGDGPGRTTLQEATLRPITGRQVLVRTEATNLCYTLVPAVLGLAPPPHAARRRQQRRPPRRARAAAEPAAHQRDGHDPRPRRRRRRRSRGARGAPRASRRSRLRLGHAALRRVLSLSARPLRHVPVPERDRPRRSRRDRRSRRRHARLSELAHRRPRRGHGRVRGVGRADLHDEAGRGGRHGLRLHERRGPGRDDDARRSSRSSRRRASPSSAAGRSASPPCKARGSPAPRRSSPSTRSAARREVALEVGATHALDPNAEGDGLVDKVRSLTTWPTDRLWSGGRNPGGRRPGSGADFVVEAAGLDAVDAAARARARTRRACWRCSRRIA